MRRHADRIWAHARGGRESGVHATPSLFLEGFFYQLVVTPEAIEADLRALIAAPG